MSKHELIERIRQINRSAPTDFLVHFEPKALEDYLSRLSLPLHGRGPRSVWVRTGNHPAVCTREV